MWLLEKTRPFTDVLQSYPEFHKLELLPNPGISAHQLRPHIDRDMFS